MRAYLSADDKRPLTDNVVVQPAQIIPYSVNARVHIYLGPSVSIVAEEYEKNLRAYLSKQHNIGSLVAKSGIYDALHTEGVQRVELLSPATDIETTK